MNRPLIYTYGVFLIYTLLLQNTYGNQRRKKIITRISDAIKFRRDFEIFQKFPNVSEINSFLRYLAGRCNSCRLGIIGNSFYGIPIYLLRIKSRLKPTILLTGGMHAREWISPVTVLYIAHQLALNPTKNDEISLMRKRFNWHFVVVLNPDGYKYSLKTLKNRYWRKNRSPNKGGLCVGTDLNRNFNIRWNESPYRKRPCRDDYPGKFPFSEPEAEALRNYALKYKNDLVAYLSFHSYGQYWMYSSINCKSNIPDEEILRSLAKIGVDRIRNFSGTKYKFGRNSCLLPYAATGTSTEWMSTKLGVKFTYTIELPPGDSADSELLPFSVPRKKIIPIARETLEGVLGFAGKINELIKAA